MSIEQVIKENTAAVIALTAAVLQKAGAIEVNTQAAPAGKSISLSIDATAKPAKEAPVTEQKSAPKTDTPVPDEMKPLVQADVAPLVAAYVKAHGRIAALKVLEPFRSITKLGLAKPEELPGIKAAFEKATAAASA